MAKTAGRSAPKRGPKLPDELHPIVDAVVEIVFERLRSVATNRNMGKAPLRRKTARLNLPLPKQRTALAEALADLLLADLASGAVSKRPSKSGKARRPAPARRGGRPPKNGRVRLK